MASSSEWETELATARVAVLHAARLTKQVLSSVKALSKADSSPVTVADFAAQALLMRTLKEKFPGDRFVGEEDSSVLRGDEVLRDKVFELYASAVGGEQAHQLDVFEMMDLIDLGGRGTGGSAGRFWVMDPVDGTAAFLKGEQYAVSLALIQDGREVLGAIVYPNVRLRGGKIVEDSVDTEGLGVMLSGARGQGTHITWLNSWDGPYHTEKLTRLQPSRREDLHVVDCDKNRASHRTAMKAVCAKLGVEFPGTDVWSSHIRYASLIIGGGDFLVRIPSGPGSSSCIWDHAGAQLLFRQLGGKITDLDGREVDFSAGRLLCRNRGLVFARDEKLHGEVLEAAREVVGDGYVS